MSPEECITALETQLKDTIKDISSLTTQNKDLYTEYLSAVPTLSKPKEIMEQLKTILLWISGNKEHFL